MKKICNPLDDAWFVDSVTPTNSKINFTKIKQLSFYEKEDLYDIFKYFLKRYKTSEVLKILANVIENCELEENENA